MSEERKDSPGDASAKDRLERTLRRWGADEAVERTRVGHAPSVESRAREPRMRPQGEGWRAILWRWAPVAAGLALLVAASGVFLAAGLRMAVVPVHSMRPTEMESHLTAQLDLALRQAEESRTALEKSRQEQAGLAEELAEARRLAEAQAGRETEARRLAAAKQDKLLRQAEALGRRIGGYEAAAVDGERKMAALNRAKAEAEEREAAMQRERAASVAAWESRLGRVEAQRVSVEARYATVLAYARERCGAGFLSGTESAVVARSEGIAWPEASRFLATNQRLSRGLRLLPRCTALEREATDSSLKELLGTLEVVLTRLEMSDPSDERAWPSLAALLWQTRAGTRAEAMLRRGELSAEARAWLTECQLVLAGVNDAA